jgi:hypothetical protein
MSGHDIQESGFGFGVAEGLEAGDTVFDFSGNGSGVGAGVSYSFGAEFTPNWD